MHNILVVGPQHSCTRLVTALLDRHPDVNHVGHWSIPSNNPPVFNFPIKNHLDTFDKIVIVNRDSNAIDISNTKSGHKIDENNSKNISYMSKNMIYNNLGEIDHNKLVFVSIETLADYKEFYIRQLLGSLGLDSNTYCYNLSGIHTFDPPRWYTVDLTIKDPNRKYLNTGYLP